MTLKKLQTFIENSTYFNIHHQQIFIIIFNNISINSENNTPGEYIDVRIITWTNETILHLAEIFKSNKLKIYKKYFEINNMDKSVPKIRPIKYYFYSIQS